jgi:hypothetical protein
MLEITNKRKTAYILEILKLFSFVIMVTPVTAVAGDKWQKMKNRFMQANTWILQRAIIRRI